MLRKRILFIDNDRDFLNTRTEFLVLAGYHVTKAYSVAEAEQQLQTGLFHLAIVDLRLVDDDRPEDESGLEFARREELRALPKIILTNWPSYEAARAMLRRFPDVAPAMDFIKKKDGPDTLLSAVADAFTNAVPVNWELTIQSAEAQPLKLLQVAVQLGEPLTEEQALSRTEELGDLLCRLFLSYQRIVLARLLWQREGRVA
jgi:DNA-binding NtrC family response regulator